MVSIGKTNKLLCIQHLSSPRNYNNTYNQEKKKPFQIAITKTCPCNEYALKPHFYIAILGYAGVYLFFLFLLQNIDCGYSLEPPHFSAENFQFLKLKKYLFIAWASFRNVCFLKPTHVNEIICH